MIKYSFKYQDEKIFENVEKTGKLLGKLLEELKLKHPSVGDVRYIGLFAAIELVKDKKSKEPLVPYGKDPEKIMGKIIGTLYSEGFATYAHENTIQVSPPLIITEKELTEAMKIMDHVLDAVDEMI